MGNLFFRQQRPSPCVMIFGLDNAGKSALVWKIRRLARNPELHTGFAAVEFANYRGHYMPAWDMAPRSQLKIWPLLRAYFARLAGLVFVVDASDPGRLDEASVVLQEVLGDEGVNAFAPLLVLANKADLENAMPDAPIAEALGLAKIQREERPVRLQRCSVTLNQGVEDGLNWLVANAVQP